MNMQDLHELEAKRWNASARKPQRHTESNLQQQCITLFRQLYPRYALLLFHVPNGVYIPKKQAAIRLSREGMVSGVADLILFLPRHGYHALCIEMKTPKGTQSPSQKIWQEEVTKQGYLYRICRSKADFITLITNYLKQ